MILDSLGELAMLRGDLDKAKGLPDRRPLRSRY